MFWGLVMEPQKKYTQTVTKAFHISQAVLDTATGDNDPCQVMVMVDGKNFLICTLQKSRAIQVPLDLFFREGDKVAFITNGKSHVHLTGYLDPEFEDEEDEDEEDEADMDEDVPELVPARNNKDKRKLNAESPDLSKLTKKQKKELKKQEAAKAAAEEESDSEVETENLRKLLEEEIDSDDNDDSYMPNNSKASAADSDEDEDDDDDDDEDDDEDESDEEETPSPAKRAKNKKQEQSPLQNGHSEKKKKGDKENEPKKQDKVEKSPVTSTKEKKTLTGNVAIEDLKVGQGAVAKPGKTVQVFYEGRLKSNNKMFDSCSKNPGFKFRLGKKEVISGWDVGVAGMRVGGKRRIVCPPGMAYGNKGSPPVIPPNSTLVFEVELKNVN